MTTQSITLKILSLQQKVRASKVILGLILSIFVAVEGLAWRCNTNIADNQQYQYSETRASEAISLDDMCFVHGWAQQFIWDSEDKKCYIVNIAE